MAGNRGTVSPGITSLIFGRKQRCATRHGQRTIKVPDDGRGRPWTRRCRLLPVASPLPAGKGQEYLGAGRVADTVLDPLIHHPRHPTGTRVSRAARCIAPGTTRPAAAPNINAKPPLSPAALRRSRSAEAVGWFTDKSINWSRYRGQIAKSGMADRQESAQAASGKLRASGTASPAGGPVRS